MTKAKTKTTPKATPKTKAAPRRNTPQTVLNRIEEAMEAAGDIQPSNPISDLISYLEQEIVRTARGR